jgi:Ca2+-binding EF-hand superfamily protein
MFDLNGDGDVDAEEFERVQEIIRQTTSNGRKHRDHANTGSTISKKMNSALGNFFFGLLLLIIRKEQEIKLTLFSGEDLSGKLTIDRFLAFQTQLQHEILALEFARKQPDDRGRISEKQLAELLIEYADYPQKKRKAVIKRVKKAYGNTEDGEQEGIALEDYIKLVALDYRSWASRLIVYAFSIFLVLMHIEDVEQALSFYTLAGASVDRDMLAHVAKVCTGAMLSEHVVDVIFTIFDEDGDGGLSNREFIAVMKNKLNRGLEKPKDTGVINFLAAVVKCAANTKAL